MDLTTASARLPWWIIFCSFPAILIGTGFWQLSTFPFFSLDLFFKILHYWSEKLLTKFGGFWISCAMHRPWVLPEPFSGMNELGLQISGSGEPTPSSRTPAGFPACSSSFSLRSALDYGRRFSGSEPMRPNLKNQCQSIQAIESPPSMPPGTNDSKWINITLLIPHAASLFANHLERVFPKRQVGIDGSPIAGSFNQIFIVSDQPETEFHFFRCLKAESAIIQIRKLAFPGSKTADLAKSMIWSSYEKPMNHYRTWLLVIAVRIYFHQPVRG